MRKPKLLLRLRRAVWNAPWTVGLSYFKGAIGLLGTSLYGLSHNDAAKDIISKIYGNQPWFLYASLGLAIIGGLTWLSAEHE